MVLGIVYLIVCEVKIYVGDIGFFLIEFIIKYGMQELEVEFRVFGNVWYVDYFSFLESGSSILSFF